MEHNTTSSTITEPPECKTTFLHGDGLSSTYLVENEEGKKWQATVQDLSKLCEFDKEQTQNLEEITCPDE